MSTMMRMISVATLVAATSSGAAIAADLQKEGSYDYKACFTRNTTRIDFSDAHRAYSYNETATAVSAAYSSETGQPFHAKADTHSTARWTGLA